MKKSLNLSSTQIILLSFLLAILVGSLLLMLPIMKTRDISYIDTLFTATSAVCVTGLLTIPAFSSWTIFGQIIILILIQIGGLGIITMMSLLLISLNKKMGLKDRILIQDAFNLNSLSGIIKFTKKVFIGTFIVEAIGALLYMLVFIPKFGLKGIWISIFNAVSAFCNAGIDIIGPNSLSDFALNPLINFITCVLIIIGGIGYFVWWDLIRVIKKYHFKGFNKLTLHSKIVLNTTLILLIIGTLTFFIFEYNNPQTMANLSLLDKLQLSIFQSVTLRTAGFMTISQKALTNASSIITLILMFIGGSPTGTAGGIKTSTIALLILTVIGAIKAQDEVSIFNRSIKRQDINKAIAVFFISIFTIIVSTILLSILVDADILDILFETVSATATVGLSRDFTSSLNTLAKLVIIGTMYLGRIGPISFVFALNIKHKKNLIKNPIEDISIG